MTILINLVDNHSADTLYFNLLIIVSGIRSCIVWQPEWFSVNNITGEQNECHYGGTFCESDIRY
jgi:hypothetical protein